MRRLISICMMSIICVFMHAQATDLVIDNQTPGWLSSKINYGDQQTVKNLKVTGYINSTDLKFIGTLIQNKNLCGRLDLYETNIVAETTSEMDNELKGNVFNLSLNGDNKKTLDFFSFPNSITSISSFGYLYLSIDTVLLDAQTTSYKRGTMNSPHNHLILGDNIESIGSLHGNDVPMKSIALPVSLKKIDDCAFYNNFENLCDVNLIKQKCFPSLEYIGWCAFREMKQYGAEEFNHPETLPDSLSFPNIKEYVINAFEYKDGMPIFLGKNLEKFAFTITAYSANRTVNLENVYFHIDKAEGFSLPSDISNITIYIPKGATNVWKEKNKFISSLTLIEESEETTGIGLKEKNTETFNKTYNLEGIKIRSNISSKSGLSKGIYIVNGKKVVVK